MFCWNCGKQIDDISKFCQYCGAKIEPISDNCLQNPTIKDTNTHQLPSITFSLRGNEITFDYRIEKYTQFRKEFMEQYQRYNDSLIEKVQGTLSKLKDSELDNCLDIFIQFGTDTITWLQKTVHQKLISMGIYTVSLEQIADMIRNSANHFSDKYTIFSEKYLEIVASAKQLEEYKALKRANRSRWEGGGFGLKGAIKGAFTAGALNIGTDMIRGIGDSWVDSSDRAKITKKKQELLASKPWVKIFSNNLQADATCAFEIYASILSKNEKIELPELNSQIGKTYFDNAKTVSSEAKKITLFAQAANSYPYSLGYYRVLFKTLGEFDCEVSQLYEYFIDPVTIEKYLERIHKEFLEKLDVLPNKTYDELEDRMSKIGERISFITENKDNSAIVQRYSAKYKSDLQKLYDETQTLRLTADDGTVCESLEDLKQYVSEKEQFSEYSKQMEKFLSLNQQIQILDAVSSINFQSQPIQKTIQGWCKSIAELRSESLYYPGSFEDYFYNVWEPETINTDSLPQYIQNSLHKLPLAPLATLLDLCKLKLSFGLFHPTIDACLIVLDYYVVISFATDREDIVIRTQQLQEIKFNFGSNELILRTDKEIKYNVYIQSEFIRNLQIYIRAINETLETAHKLQSESLCPVCKTKLLPQAAFCGSCRHQVSQVNSSIPQTPLINFSSPPYQNT